MATDEVGVRNEEYYNGWMTSENTKDNVCVNIEEVEKLEDGKRIADEEKEGSKEVSNTTDTLESHEDLREKNEDTDESVRAGTSVDKDVLQHSVQNNVLDHMNELADGAGSSQDFLQVKHVTSQTEETDENLPYLTIGTGPENQTTGVDTNTAKGTSGPLRPIRRVLTWPPTAAQWKKQWAQNQQVLNVFPQLVFVTGCRHEIRPFPPSISPAIFPLLHSSLHWSFYLKLRPQWKMSNSLLMRTLTGQVLSHPIKEACISVQKNASLILIYTKGDGRIITNGETWTSGLESTIFPIVLQELTI